MKSASLIPDKAQLIGLYHEFQKNISVADIPYVTALRNEALKSFETNGFPTQEIEEWKNTSLINSLKPSYNFYFNPFKEKQDVDKIFRCEIHNFETDLFTQLNGWYIYKQKPITTLDNGVIAGSLSAAFRAYPDLIQQHYGKLSNVQNSGLTALNTAFAQDGIFIYVPDNVTVEKPIQMVNIVNIDESIFVQPRNLIILGKNAKLTFVYCDDSIRHETSFINSCTETFIGEGLLLIFTRCKTRTASPPSLHQAILNCIKTANSAATP